MRASERASFSVGRIRYAASIWCAHAVSYREVRGLHGESLVCHQVLLPLSPDLTGPEEPLLTVLRGDGKQVADTPSVCTVRAYFEVANSMRCRTGGRPQRPQILGHSQSTPLPVRCTRRVYGVSHMEGRC